MYVAPSPVVYFVDYDRDLAGRKKLGNVCNALLRRVELKKVRNTKLLKCRLSRKGQTDVVKPIATSDRWCGPQPCQINPCP